MSVLIINTGSEFQAIAHDGRVLLTGPCSKAISRVLTHNDIPHRYVY